MQEVIKALYTEPFSVTELVDCMEELFPDDYSGKVGVWEGYTLREHTRLVLGQFEKYFSDRELLGGIGWDHFQLFLAMHDLGKPEAVRKERKHDQSIFNLVSFDAHYPVDWFILEGPRSILRSFKADYPIGPYLRELFEVVPSADSTRGMQAACSSYITLSEFHHLLLTYYMSDAGNYTVDAGGKRSLDHLFIFGEGRMTFSPDTEWKMQLLRKVLIGK